MFHGLLLWVGGEWRYLSVIIITEYTHITYLLVLQIWDLFKYYVDKLQSAN